VTGVIFLLFFAFVSTFCDQNNAVVDRPLLVVIYLLCQYVLLLLLYICKLLMMIMVVMSYWNDGQHWTGVGEIKTALHSYLFILFIYTVCQLA